jgi:hypothetical protein
MGTICRALAEEARFEGQQVVIVAADVLNEHFITGQMPIEDNHLGARLAWIDPVPERRPQDIADERARKAASGILVNTPDQRDDDEVDRLRRIHKRGTRRERAAAAARMQRILHAAVRREWEMLVQARRAFWSAGFAAHPLTDLVQASVARLGWSIQNFAMPRRPNTLSYRLENYEASARDKEETATLIDPMVRDSQRRRGRVLVGRVRAVHQPTRGRRPCRVTMTSDQELLRLRLDDEIKSCDGAFKGVVRDIARDQRSGERSITVELTSGVRSTGRLAIGTVHEWIQADDFPLYLRKKAFDEARDRASWLLFGTAAPAPAPLRLPRTDPLVLANAARRR